MNDKKINALVVGMGKSGIASADALLSIGAGVSVYDKKTPEETDSDLNRYFKEKNIECYFGSEPADIGIYNLVVMSPGVPMTIDIVKKAEQAGVEIIGEVELAYRLSKGRYVAITGTNGKTTTTVLTGEIFKKAGLACEVVGNVGVPAAGKAASATEDTWLITEISSFQLETIRDFHPHISAVLNITPDHLNRHGTFENYVSVKARIFENQDKGDYFIVNRDDRESMKIAADCTASVVPFSRKEILEFGAFIQNGIIVIKDKDGSIHEMCKASELGIPGAHNLENALAASAVAFFAGIESSVIGKTLREFKGVEHRLEFCGEIQGVRFVNDSKGTNPDASIKALQAIDKGIVLIAGGYDKGSSFEEFIKAFDGKVKALILLGKTAPKIKAAAESLGFTNTIIVKDMEECVTEAFKAAGSGDTVYFTGMRKLGYVYLFRAKMRTF